MCEVGENGTAIIAYAKGKGVNKPIAGAQKKYNLSKEFNTFATVKLEGAQQGDVSFEALESAKAVKSIFYTKGRGFSGVMKRWNFQGSPAAHGSRFHRRVGSIGNREWPGRVQKGKKMAGHYGNEIVNGKNVVLSFDKQSNILVLKGSVAGHKGAYGRIQVI